MLNIFVYCCWSYKGYTYKLHFCCMGANQRTCYKLQSKKIELWSIINFYLPTYDFKLGIYLKFGK